MTDPLELAERLESHMGLADMNEVLRDCRQAAQIIREQQSQIDAKDFALRNGKSLSEDAMHAVREMLREQGVPEAAFIDDHIANAIVQRNHAREALEPFAQEHAWDAETRFEIVVSGQTGSITGADLDRARSLVGRADHEA